MTSTTIQFDSVTKSFGKTNAIFDLSLEMPETGIVGLIGRNGSGKTTFLNLTSSLLLPTSGQVSVMGETSAKLPDATIAAIGVVPHKPRFMERFSCQQYLNLLSSFYGSWDSVRVNRLMKEFGLDPTQRIMGLSEGQRQMLAIIVATAHRPRILLMDEPMSNLDPIARANTIHMLWEMLIDDGVLIILSSHILNDIEKIADWITFLDAGKTREHDSLDNLHQRYQKWEVFDPHRSFDPTNELPGVINAHHDGKSWTMALSDALHPTVLEKKATLNGSVEVSHLSLEAIFPHLNPESVNEK